MSSRFNELLMDAEHKLKAARAAAESQAATPETKPTGSADEADCGSAPKADPAAALRARLKDLATRANAGDHKALAELRVFLNDHPEVAEFVGNLAKIAERAWIGLVVDEGVLGRETVQRQLKKLKAELAGEHPTTLEQLLVDHIAVCHLAEHHAQMLAADVSGGTIPQAVLRLKRSESAQKRFLTAIRTLTTLRARAPAGLAPLDSIKIHTPNEKLA